MFAELFEFAKHNPILLGGVGTVLFSALMYFVKGVPRGAFATLKRGTTVEMFLTSEHALYHDILSVLTSHRIGLFSRNFTTSRAGELVSGYGRSIGTYHGRVFIFDRELIQNNLRLDESVRITLLSRNRALLTKLLGEAVQPNDRDKIKVLTSWGGGYWSTPAKKRRRSLDTVFVPEGVKQAILDKIKWFLANEAWYLERGIPYKLIFLFHGEPGTGKTSLIYATASHFNRDLGLVSHVGNLDRLFESSPEGMFFVIEDIDMLSISRAKEAAANEPQPIGIPNNVLHVDSDGSKALSALQVLINTLDGLSTPHGLILFITTNYKERLDPALIRVGRIDCDLTIGRLGAREVEEMFVAFYGEERRNMIHQYTHSQYFQPHTGAELQVLFMSKPAPVACEILGARERPHLVRSV